MVVFVDTSALFALVDNTDRNHAVAQRLWPRVLGERRLTTNYVVVETIALLQRRLGWTAVSLFRQDLEPRLQLVWVDAALHAAGVAIWESQRTRDLSLVDCVSFACIARDGMDGAFAFDEHFATQGVRVLA